MWKVVLIVLLIAHGVVHIADVATEKNKSWLFGDARALAWVMAALAAGFLVASGAGLWTNAGWWRSAAVLGMALSVLWMSTFFELSYLPIVALNIALIIGIAALSWPSVDTVGA
jgi:hypothetical protein